MGTTANDERGERFLRGQSIAKVVLSCHDVALRCLWASNIGDRRIRPSTTSDIMSGEDVAIFEEIIKSSARSGSTVRVALRLRFAPRFEPKWYDVTTEPIFTDGTVAEVACAAVDITECREMAMALARARLVAETASRAAWSFFAAASHDLRQPFQAMRLFQHILVNRLTDSESRDVAAKLGEAISSGERLLNALLDISTLDAGTVEPRVGVFPLIEILVGLKREFAAQAEAAGLAFRLVPPRRTMAQTDPVLLERILRNLLANAVRHNRTGGCVLMGCRRQRGAARIEVWNTGPGIPAEVANRIFDGDRQPSRPVCDRSSGLGLGLPTVTRMAKLLELPLTLRSEPGRWAMFGVTVPEARQLA